MTNKKRAKNEPTKGDLLAQAYRNRAAMKRVYWAALWQREGIPVDDYWTPLDMNEYGEVK